MIDFDEEDPPVSAAELAAAEARLAELGHRIPPSYRAFLAERDGGRPVQRLYMFSEFGGPPKPEPVHFFNGVGESNTSNLVKDIGLLLDSIPAGLLPIADDPFGNMILLDGRDGRDGPVLFWNHELAPEDPPPDVEFPVIAPDLASFLDMLYEDTEPLPELPRPWWRRVLGR